MKKLYGLLIVCALWAYPALAQQVPTTLMGDCSGSGITSIAANCVKSSAPAVSAAGTTLATATALTAKVNAVTTVASGTGVSLPAYNPAIGGAQITEVINAGANALAVYPPTASAAIWNLNGATSAGAAGAASSLAVGTHASFECVSATLCYAAP